MTYTLTREDRAEIQTTVHQMSWVMSMRPNIKAGMADSLAHLYATGKASGLDLMAPGAGQRIAAAIRSVRERGTVAIHPHYWHGNHKHSTR